LNWHNGSPAPRFSAPGFAISIVLCFAERDQVAISIVMLDFALEIWILIISTAGAPNQLIL
jgi:hypothetical protein